MPDPTTGVAGATAPGATPPAAKPSSLGGLGKDAFLQLLVAQLKYQNPLSPSDPSEMMGQTAQFTMVEKLEDLAASVQQQIAAQRGALAASLVGKTVSGATNVGAATTGVVTEVSLNGEQPTLTVGGRQVALSTVTTIK